MEIPRMRPTSGCFIVLFLKLALLFSPFGPFFAHTREKSDGRAYSNSFSFSQICCSSGTLQNYFENYFITLKSYEGDYFMGQ